MIRKAKTCSTCGEEKSIDKFYRNARNKDGRTYQCKICHNKSCRASYLEWQKTEKGKRSAHRRYINRLIKESTNG